MPVPSTFPRHLIRRRSLQQHSAMSVAGRVPFPAGFARGTQRERYLLGGPNPHFDTYPQLQPVFLMSTKRFSHPKTRGEAGPGHRVLRRAQRSRHQAEGALARNFIVCLWLVELASFTWLQVSHLLKPRVDEGMIPAKNGCGHS